MTYLDLLRDADRQLDDGRITIGEYEQMIKPLEREVQPEVVRCDECRHYKPMSSNWGNCYVHGSPMKLHRTCLSCDYCSWAERRTE